MHFFGLIKRHAAAATLLAAVISPPAAAPAPALQMVGLSASQTELVSHAVDLFAEAGLELPPVEVRLGTGIPRCEERPGLHQRSEGVSVIHLCYPKIAGREFRVLTHELAHAWAREGLTVERRDEFQVLRGWQYWHDYDRAKWRDNGTEQAAEIIKWGVSDRPVPLFVADSSCAELRDGYRALTGTEPAPGRTELCEAQTDGAR